MSNINKPVKNFLPTILGILTLAGVVISIFNFYILATMAPLAREIAILDTEIKANTQIDTTEHSTFVTGSTFKEVVTRIDHISGRVDAIYSILVK